MDDYEMLHRGIGEDPYFQGHLSNFKATWAKKSAFGPDLSFSGWYFYLELMDGNGALHTIARGIREESYCFSRSSVTVQGHAVQKKCRFEV